MPIRARTLAPVALFAGLLMSSTLHAQSQLPPCPPSPNCVSSAADPADDHYVAPLPGKANAQESLAALIEVLKDMPRVSWEKVTDNHIHATFTSMIFRFDDDVDFIVHTDGSIAVRSASRVGYSDLGANRRRIERLRVKLSQTRF